MKLPIITKSINNFKTINEIRKISMNNSEKIKDYMIKINSLTNMLTYYMEKNKRTEDKELIGILEKLVEIQEMFLSIKNDTIINVKQIKKEFECGEIKHE